MNVPRWDDDDAWQVFADALIEAGDPRGELITVSRARANATSEREEKRLDARIETLRSARRQAWIEGAERGDVARSSRVNGWPVLDGAVDAASRSTDGALEIEWENGYVYHARVLSMWDPNDGAAILKAVLIAPCAEAIVSIAVDREHREDVSMGDLGRRGLVEWATPIFQECGELPGLEIFRIGPDPDADMHLSETSNAMMTSAAPGTPGAEIHRPDLYIGDVAPALAQMPALRELRLTGEGIRIETLPPTLRSLVIETRFLRATALRAIASAKLPELERLELWLGNWPDSVVDFGGPEGEEFYGRATGPDDLAALLEGANVPALRRLALSNCAWMPSLIAALAESKIVGQLTELDLSYGFMNGAGVAPLLENAKRWKHLRRIDLTNNQIMETATQRALVDAFGERVVLEPQNALGGNLALRLLSF